MGLTKRLRELLGHREKYSQWSHPGGRSHIQLIEDWKDLSNYYTSKGLSKSKSYEKIAEQYGIARHTLIYWLEPGYREKYLSRQRCRR